MSFRYEARSCESCGAEMPPGIILCRPCWDARIEVGRSLRRQLAEAQARGDHAESSRIFKMARQFLMPRRPPETPPPPLIAPDVE